MKRKYFHTFDFMRFFSFILVFFHHIPINKTSIFSRFSHSGTIGVSFFFVLSGFLITYILIHEKETNQKVDLRKFFLKRTLRIWPLFYLMILFAFLTPYFLETIGLSSSNEGYKPDWFVSCLFLENYKMMFSNTFPDGAPLRVMWSLCVEEHFYVLWGVLLYFLSVEKIPLLIIASIVVANLARAIYWSIDIASSDIFSNIDYFAYGAIPAYFLTQKKQVINRVEEVSIYVKYLLGIIVLITVFTIPNLNIIWLKYLSPTLFGTFFSILILFTLCDKNQIKVSDTHLISKLGVYTYGLYLYHTIVINLFLQVLKNWSYSYKMFVIGVGSLLLTIIMSSLSYHFFEKQFLKLKKHL